MERKDDFKILSEMAIAEFCQLVYYAGRTPIPYGPLVSLDLD